MNILFEEKFNIIRASRKKIKKYIYEKMENETNTHNFQLLEWKIHFICIFPTSSLLYFSFHYDYTLLKIKKIIFFLYFLKYPTLFVRFKGDES